MKLSTKSVAVLLLALLVTLGFSSWIGIQNESHTLNEFLKKQGKSLTQTIAVFSIEILLSEDYPVLDTFLETLGKEREDIRLIEVIHQGKLVSKYHSDRIGLSNPVIFSSDILFSIDRNQDPGKMGEVRVGLSDEENKLVIASRLKKIIIIVASTLVVLALIQILLINRVVIRPIQKLATAIHMVPKGELNNPINIKSSDEIGDLASSFNKMMEDLQKTTVSKNYTDNIIRNMTDSLVVVNTEGKIQTINQATLKLLGYKEEELLNQPVKIIFAEDSDGLNNNAAALSNLISKRIVENVEKNYVSRDGKKIPVLFSGSDMRDRDGNVKGIICVAQNLTERIRTEEEAKKMQLKMIAASKLTALGEMATGAAHEINQPLTFISGTIQSISRDVTKGLISHANEAEFKENLKDASYQINRIVSIIDHLRAFGRQYDRSMGNIYIETVLNNTILLLGERMRLKNIKLIRHIEEDLPAIIGNAHQLEQVFINLFQNAIDAFGEKIKTAEIIVDISLSDNPKAVQIQFSDNGPGIEKSLMEKIFEPFFTTKEIGKGTGLGLSIVYGIIKEHKGSITCKSKINTGTIFNILLPVGGSNVKQ